MPTVGELPTKPPYWSATSVGIVIVTAAPERSFGAGAALGDERVPGPADRCVLRGWSQGETTSLVCVPGQVRGVGLFSELAGLVWVEPCQKPFLAPVA
jgi:hypothetical protein